jgi:hypothetical protein
MKKAFLCCIMLAALKAEAQKRFSEGTVKYIVETRSGTPVRIDSSVYSLMLKGATIRSELKSAIGKTVAFFDAREGSGAVTREFGDQRILIPMERTSWSDLTAEFREMRFEKSDGDSVIFSFPCKRAMGTMKDGSILTIWYTEDILPEITEINFPLANLPGWPLLVEMEKKNAHVFFKVAEINFDPVPVQFFEMPRSGFRILSYRESKQFN